MKEKLLAANKAQIQKGVLTLQLRDLIVCCVCLALAAVKKHQEKGQKGGKDRV